MSRYIHSEKEMDDYLLELGISDVKLKLFGKEDFLTQEQPAELLQAILEMESFIGRIERKGNFIPRIHGFAKC